MSEERRRGPGRPPRISREQILDAAFALVAETGTLVMSDVGQRLGVDGSSIYRYFRGKGELVSAMADAFSLPLREELPLTDSWRTDIEVRLRRLERHYRRQPAVAMMIMSETELAGPVLEVIADGVAVLRRSGAAEADVFAAIHALEMIVFGSIGYDAVGGSEADAIRRNYQRQLGVFDVDTMFPTADDLAEESTSTMWMIVGGVLDWLERRAVERPAD